MILPLENRSDSMFFLRALSTAHPQVFRWSRVLASAARSGIAAAVNPATNQIYVVNSASDNVTAVDGAMNATSAVIMGSQPAGVAVNPVWA